MIKVNKILLSVYFSLFSIIISWGQVPSFAPADYADTLNSYFAKYLGSKEHELESKDAFLNLFNSNCDSLSYFFQAGSGKCNPSFFWEQSNTTANILSVTSLRGSLRLCSEESNNYMIMPAKIKYKIFDDPVREPSTTVYIKYSFSYLGERIMCKIAGLQLHSKAFDSCSNIELDTWMQTIPSVNPPTPNPPTPNPSTPNPPTQNPVVRNPVVPCPRTYKKKYTKCEEKGVRLDSIVAVLRADSLSKGELISNLQDSIRAIKQDMIELHEYKDCMDDFAEKRSELENEARQHIDKANAAYLFFRENKLLASEENEKLETLLIDTLRFCFKEYYENARGFGEYRCKNGLELYYDDSYLKPEESLYYGQMLVKYKNFGLDKGRNSRLSSSAQLLSLLSSEDKLNEANALILWNVAQVMKSGTKRQKEVVQELVELLPISIRPDTISVEGTYPNLAKDVGKIYTLFESERYPDALELYNRTESFFFTTAFSRNSKNCRDIAQAKAAVGEILLYDYCDIDNNSVLGHKGSWLNELHNTTVRGKALLREALKTGCLDSKSEKRATVALHKFFSVERKK